MNNKKDKRNIRLLPAFIVIAILALSVRVNNVFDIVYSENELSLFTHSTAIASNNNEKEIEELSEILESNKSFSTPQTARDPEELIQSEVYILQDLARRREAMEIRSKEIDKKAMQLKVAESQIEAKLTQLKEYEAKLKDLMKEYDANEKEKINSLVKLYSTMRPKDTARIFDTLDIDIVVILLQEMKPSTSSAILSQMDITRTKLVTNKIIGN